MQFPAGQTNRAVRTVPAAPRREIPPHRYVAIGGGTGLPVVLKGLRRALSLERQSSERLTAIVTVTDDGGSSGRLRRQLGMLPPGDVRNCLTALCPDDSPFVELLQHRFAAGSALAGHPVGNLLLAAFTEIAGEFQTAVERLGALIDLRGCVLPSTAANVTLCAEFHDGDTIRGETAIGARGARIKRISLDRPVRPLPETMRALVNADVITVGPGSLYTSIIPNLLVGGVASTIAGVEAVRIYVANLMGEPGETEGYSLEDHLTAIHEHVGFDLFDYVLVNRRPICSSVAAKYAERGSTPVQCGHGGALGTPARIIERDLWEVSDGKLRHDPRELSSAILELTRVGRPVASEDVTADLGTTDPTIGAGAAH